MEPLSSKRYKITEKGKEIAARNVPITFEFPRQLPKEAALAGDRKTNQDERSSNASALETGGVETEMVSGLAFTLKHALEDLFIEADALQEMLTLWRTKKNLVLQGAPGVGKTFLAKRLAYLLLGCKDDMRVRMIQFHQSYAYEDFVQGYRPTELGGFRRRDGVFFAFASLANADPNRPYVFIIDEIN